MGIDFETQVDIKQAGISRIVGASAMLQPFTPMFVAHASTAYQNITPSLVLFDMVMANVGNGYNPATGWFTAPAAGAYYFFANILTDSSNTYENVHGLFKNGGWYAGSIRIQWNPTPSYLSLVVSAHVNMAAGDYVGMYRSSGGPGLASGGYSSFGGALVA